MVGNPDRVDDLNRLADICERLGLRVLEMPGWEKRGRGSGNTFEVLGCHHTAGASDNDRLLRDGDAALRGPRCNVALHRNGDVVLVASGRANHFGSATWPNSRSLGVEATGPQVTGKKFPNYDAYVRLAAAFCILKGRADPRRVVRADVGIPVHLVAAHKEVAVDKATKRIYGRKIDPAFDQDGRLMKGALPHGFRTAGGGIRLIDTFRNQVHAFVQEDDDMTKNELLDVLRSDQGQKILRQAVGDEVTAVLRAGFGKHAPGHENDEKVGTNQQWLFDTVEGIRKKLGVGPA